MKIINLSQKERARLIVEKEWTIENAAYYFCNVKNKILYGIHDSTEPSTQYVEIQPTIEGLINEMIKFFQNCKESSHICLCTRVRLNISMFCTKKFTSSLSS